MHEVSARSQPTRPLSRGKRIAFRLGALLLAYGAAELLGMMVLLVHFGRVPSMGEISAQTQLGPPKQQSTYLPAAALHPYLGYVHTPRSTPRTTMAVESASIAVDEQNRFSVAGAVLSDQPQPAASDWGFLDARSPIRRRSPQTILVGITGGSVAESFSVEGAAALTSSLQKVDRFAGKKIELVRLGVQGFKQPQQLLSVTWLLSLGAEFDVLVNLDGFNELLISIVENYERGVAPDYPWLWDLRMQTAGGAADRVIMGRIAATGQRRSEWADFVIRYPWRTSHMARCLWLVMSNRLEQQQVENWRQLERAASSASRTNPALSGPYQQFAGEEQLYAHCVGIWKRSSLQLHQLCERHAITYYHFLQPNQYVSGSKPMAEPERLQALTPGSPFERVVQRGYPLLAAAGAELRRQGVRFHSLMDVFAGHEELLYKDNCCHLNRSGNQILAAEVARVIAEHP